MKVESEVFGCYLLDTNCTIRDLAKRFGVSKTTAHRRVTKVLKRENPGLAADVRVVLDQHKIDRARAGGLAAVKKKALAKGRVYEKESK